MQQQSSSQRVGALLIHRPAWVDQHTGGSWLTPTVHRCPKGMAVGGPNKAQHSSTVQKHPKHSNIREDGQNVHVGLKQNLNRHGVSLLFNESSCLLPDPCEDFCSSPSVFFAVEWDAGEDDRPFLSLTFAPVSSDSWT